VVVGLRTDEVVAALQARSRPDHVVLDLVSLPRPEMLRGTYQGVCW